MVLHATLIFVPLIISINRYSILFGCFCTTSIGSMYAATNENSLSYRRFKLSLEYTTRLGANPDNPVYSCFGPLLPSFMTHTNCLFFLLELMFFPIFKPVVYLHIISYTNLFLVSPFVFILSNC